mgnify:CR=1 FL=1
MLTLGIDIGSTASKAVIMRDGTELIAESIVPVGTARVTKRSFSKRSESSRYIRKSNRPYPGVHGYGRMGFKQAAREIREISCHARGVHYLVPTAGTIIDIGGQDAKAIRVDADGR